MDEGDGWRMVVGDASRCYPGLLTKFVRTLALLGSDFVLIRDVVECDGEHHAEWLMHAAGDVTTEGEITVVENKDVRMTVTPFLPDRSLGWRASDVVRTSTYPESSQGKMVTKTRDSHLFSHPRFVEVVMWRDYSCGCEATKYLQINR